MKWILWPGNGKTGVNRFTPVELLLVIVCTVVFAAVLLPALRGGQAGAEQSACLNQLRMCGRANSLYADDHDGRFVQYRNWTNDFWTGIMFSDGYLQRRDVIYCPDMVPSEFAWSSAYGVLKQQATLWPGISTADPCWTFQMSAVKQPSGVPYLGDSAEPAGAGLQQIVFVEPFGAKRTWHLRHLGRANIWYLDGHAAAEDRQLGRIFAGFLENNAVSGARDSECRVWLGNGQFSENIR
ncbi:MAG: prepilin-type N-terminal cleavage/methylation domain-containing protein [Lentisphaeria bacterium]|nr:prepilin-type N-terminal cleavage/methylation domain-containing protein [Lentisphaeria bacterium]